MIWLFWKFQNLICIMKWISRFFRNPQMILKIFVIPIPFCNGFQAIEVQVIRKKPPVWKVFPSIFEKWELNANLHLARSITFEATIFKVLLYPCNGYFLTNKISNHWFLIEMIGLKQFTWEQWIFGLYCAILVYSMHWWSTAWFYTSPNFQF